MNTDNNDRLIILNDILGLTKSELDKTKVRFMRESKEVNFNPNDFAENVKKRDVLNFEHLVKNSEKKIWFEDGVIAIGFVPYKKEKDHWLMTGVLRVLKDNGYDKFAEAEYLDETKYGKYSFRVIVEYHKKSQAGVLRMNKINDELIVNRILSLSESKEISKFPGFGGVSNISYRDLQKKLDVSEDWRINLQSRWGVYLITDMQTGKRYVGSAYGEDGIYGRWKVYVDKGYDASEENAKDYPNKGLQELVQKNGLDYIKNNFLYSILETFPQKDSSIEGVSKETVIGRENRWKEVLLSRDERFGYNKN